VSTFALTVSYDGHGFAGSQVQPAARTVQGVLAEALAAIYGQQVAMVFAGRTDAGVHAAGQVVSFVAPHAGPDPTKLLAALNHSLPDDVAVAAVNQVPVGFNARFAARWREYRYRIWSGNREPLARGWVWRRGFGLDLEMMNRAAAMLRGRHDFASFAGGGEGVPWSKRRERPRGTIRTLFASEVRELEPWWRPRGPAGRLIEYRVVGDGFLPRMVRSLISALVDVARGKREPEWIAAMLRAHDRRLAGGTAPAHGLTLWQVGYAAFPAQGIGQETAVAVAGSPPPVDDRMETTGRTQRGTADLVTEGA